MTMETGMGVLLEGGFEVIEAESLLEPPQPKATSAATDGTKRAKCRGLRALMRSSVKAGDFASLVVPAAAAQFAFRGSSRLGLCNERFHSPIAQAIVPPARGLFGETPPFSPAVSPTLGDPSGRVKTSSGRISRGKTNNGAHCWTPLDSFELLCYGGAGN